MDNFYVAWADRAKLELAAITQYITDRGAPEAAEKLEEKILLAAGKLSYSPYRVFYDKKRGLHKVGVGNYLILFRINENTIPKRVQIMRVIHGRRNLSRWIR